MRKIKFRGKRLDNGEWVYGDLHIRTPFPHIHSEIDYGKVDIDPHTVGQFTGLYVNYGYALVRRSMDKLVAAVRLAIGAFTDFGWFVPRQQVQRLPQRRTIGKEHRGYAKSRLRIHQRRG